MRQNSAIPRYLLPLAFAFAALAPVLSAQANVATTPAAHAALPAEFDAYVADVLRIFEIPGLCIAVVKDGETVLAKGYGVQNLGAATPVDERTNFGIASNSKVFTAVALTILAERGKLRFDDRVVDHLPSFQLSDPYVSRELTVLDLLVHRSGLGLGAGDLLWWPGSTYDRKQVVARLRHVPLATSFRSTYAYDNVLYLVAGEVIEALSGQTWEQFVREQILQPVGMAHSFPNADAAIAAGNAAGTFARVDGTVQAVVPDNSDTTNPAGGIRSNAEDMARWLKLLLGRGRLGDGQPLISEAGWRRLTTLVTPIPVKDPDPVLAELRPNFRGYALGLGVSDYRGKKLITHTGGLPGAVSRVLWVPDLQFGIAVLTNQECLPGIDAIVYRALDHQFHADDKDWLKTFQQAESKARQAVAEQVAKAASERKPGRPSLPLAAYAGSYQDRWYGDIDVIAADDGLRITFAHTPLLTGRLEPWQHDTFVARWDDRGLRADAFVNFTLMPDGTIDHATMAPFSGEVDFSFDYQDLLLRPKPRPR